MSADLSDTSRRMNGAVASLESDFQGLRTGRASTGMLDAILALIHRPKAI